MILLHELFNGLVTFFKCTLQEIRLNEIKISGNVSFLHPGTCMYQPASSWEKLLTGLINNFFISGYYAKNCNLLCQTVSFGIPDCRVYFFPINAW